MKIIDSKVLDDLILKNEKISYYLRDEEEINKGNRLVVFDEKEETVVDSFPNLRIIYNGKNSLIRIHKSAVFNMTTIVIGEGGYIFIDKAFRTRHKSDINLGGENGTLFIGAFSNFGNADIFAGDEPNLEIVIGREFISAINLVLRASDGHTIYDNQTKQVLNKPSFGIHICSHVWCGLNVTIIKDAIIPKDCVIGACSLVTKNKFEPNSAIGGVPAKTIKTGINWDKVNVNTFESKNNV